jgi:hypothetical protein
MRQFQAVAERFPNNAIVPDALKRANGTEDHFG